MASNEEVSRIKVNALLHVEIDQLKVAKYKVWRFGKMNLAKFWAKDLWLPSSPDFNPLTTGGQKLKESNFIFLPCNDFFSISSSLVPSSLSKQYECFSCSQSWNIWTEIKAWAHFPPYCQLAARSCWLQTIVGMERSSWFKLSNLGSYPNVTVTWV